MMYNHYGQCAKVGLLSAPIWLSLFQYTSTNTSQYDSTRALHDTSQYMSDTRQNESTQVRPKPSRVLNE